MKSIKLKTYKKLFKRTLFSVVLISNISMMPLVAFPAELSVNKKDTVTQVTQKSQKTDDYDDIEIKKWVDINNINSMIDDDKKLCEHSKENAKDRMDKLLSEEFSLSEEDSIKYIEDMCLGHFETGVYWAGDLIFEYNILKKESTSEKDLISKLTTHTTFASGFKDLDVNEYIPLPGIKLLILYLYANLSNPPDSNHFNLVYWNKFDKFDKILQKLKEINDKNHYGFDEDIKNLIGLYINCLYNDILEITPDKIKKEGEKGKVIKNVFGFEYRIMIFKPIDKLADIHALLDMDTAVEWIVLSESLKGVPSEVYINIIKYIQERWNTN